MAAWQGVSLREARWSKVLPTVRRTSAFVKQKICFETALTTPSAGFDGVVFFGRRTGLKQPPFYRGVTTIN